MWSRKRSFWVQGEEVRCIVGQVVLWYLLLMARVWSSLLNLLVSCNLIVSVVSFQAFVDLYSKLLLYFSVLCFGIFSVPACADRVLVVGFRIWYCSVMFFGIFPDNTL